jgi:hypothetical protein
LADWVLSIFIVNWKDDLLIGFCSSMIT